MTHTTTLTTPAEREIVAERTYDAARERVWQAFVDPELIPRWWGPRRMTTIVERLDVRVGGEWRFIMREPDGTESGFRGVFREVNAPEKIVRTFEWEPMPGHVIIESATFEDLGGSTRVVTTQVFHTTEERDGMLASGMEGGMTESHDRLTELLAA